MKPILIDLDCTLVDMLPPWLKRYNELKGTNVQLSDIKDYDVGLVCEDHKTLYGILDEPGFFFNMDAMPNGVLYFQKLLDEGYDLVVVTQPPRRADLAIHDKRNWMKHHFPSYDLSNMIFCHRKDLISGAVLFDDKPEHLVNWQENNPHGLTATLDWHFNKSTKTNFRGSLDQGWKQFYEWINATFPRK